MDKTFKPDPYRQIESCSASERKVWEAIWTVEDPELPVSIADLGLVYDISVQEDHADIDMTLTYSGCPAREMIVDDVKRAVKSVEFIDSVTVNLVYSPPWSFNYVTDRGRENLKDHGLSVPTDSEPSDVTCK